MYTPPPALRLGIIGIGGRMGQAIATEAARTGADVIGGIGRDQRPTGDLADAAALARAVDVLIDFSTPAALPASLAAAQAGGAALLIGTTGLASDDHARIDAASATIAILQTANTSLGITLLRALVRQAAERLGPDWDVEIVEMHHRHKVDAPSGTALLLGAAAAEGRAAAGHAAPSRTDRMAGAGARAAGEIHYAALRGGSVAGDHQVILATDGERIELGHRAESRAIFANGALRAAQWLVGRRPGRYAMDDVLGI